MSNAKGKKKKSSGWRPLKKRGSWRERWDRNAAAQTAKARLDCDELRPWRICPVRRCRRVRGCTGDPRSCLEERRPKAAASCHGVAPPGTTKNPATEAADQTPRFALSASDAAAAIAASIAGTVEPAALPGEELEPVFRDGGIHYVPRRQR